MKRFFHAILHRLKVAYCKWQAARIVARTKARWPGCEGAVNSWPTTGATGNGNAATGQYIANGTATTLLWGTNNLFPITGWLTVLRVTQRTLMAFDENLPNGDGLTAGKVQGIDGFEMDIEVRDDTTQVTTGLTVGQRLLLQDPGGLVPGGARGATYSCILTKHDWETAPKTAAGRTLTVQKFLLIT